MKRAAFAASSLGWVLLVGCTGSVSSSVAVAPGGYPRAFEAARDVLLSNRYTLERVDAEEGVLTTAPRLSSGLGTPWNSPHSSLEQEIDDLAHKQTRTVRVTFDAIGDGKRPDGAASREPLPEQATIVARFEVLVDRESATGWRPSPHAILYSSDSTDPLAVSRGRASAERIPWSRDERLAARYAAELRRAIDRAR